MFVIFYSFHIKMDASKIFLAEYHIDIHIQSLNNLCFIIFVIFCRKPWFGQKVDKSIFFLIFFVLLLRRTFWVIFLSITCLMYVKYILRYLHFFVFCDLRRKLWFGQNHTKITFLYFFIFTAIKRSSKEKKRTKKFLKFILPFLSNLSFKFFWSLRRKFLGS